MMREAYNRAVRRKNIMPGFKKAGIWPMDSTVLLGVSHPESSNLNCRLVSVNEIESLMEQRWMEKRTSLEIKPTVAASRILDTSSGLMLTSPESLALAKRKCLWDKARHRFKMRREAQNDLKEAHQIALVRAERLQHEKKEALAIRVGIYKSPNDMPREMHVRRRKARERQAKGVEVVNELVLKAEMHCDIVSAI